MELITQHPAQHQQGMRPAAPQQQPLHTSSSTLHLVDNSSMALETTLWKRPSSVLLDVNGYSIDSFSVLQGGTRESEMEVFQSAMAPHNQAEPFPALCSLSYSSSGVSPPPKADCTYSREIHLEAAVEAAA